MGLRDLIGRFRRTLVSPGSELWREEQKRIRAESKLSGLQSRVMRNAQSAIRKDIKATEREIRKSTDRASRTRLERYLEKLRALQRDMRQSNKVDGQRVYNRRAAREDAMSEYLADYKGRDNRIIYMSGRRAVSEQPVHNRMFENMGGQAIIDKIVGDTWAPALDDLVNEYYQAVRAYDYSRADDTLRRIRGMANRLDRMYNDVPRGSTDYDSIG